MYMLWFSAVLFRLTLWNSPYSTAAGCYRGAKRAFIGLEVRPLKEHIKAITRNEEYYMHNLM